jgi:hypothetical protein
MGQLEIFWHYHHKEKKFSLKSTGTVYQWFGLKTIGTVSFGLASKPVASCFPIWASKLVAMVW